MNKVKIYTQLIIIILLIRLIVTSKDSCCETEVYLNENCSLHSITTFKGVFVDFYL